MSLMYDDDECNDCIHYVKPVSNTNLWRCAFCLIAESAICLDGETTMMDRYELYCGHEAHERCYRTWAKKATMVGCPHCGMLGKVEGHRFCEVCSVFGHGMTANCVVKQSRNELMQHAIEAKEERAKYVPFSLK